MQEFLKQIATEKGYTLLKNRTVVDRSQIIYEMYNKKTPETAIRITHHQDKFLVMKWNSMDSFPVVSKVVPKEQVSEAVDDVSQSTVSHTSYDTLYIEAILKSPVNTASFTKSLLSQYLQKGKLSEKQSACLVYPKYPSAPNFNLSVHGEDPYIYKRYQEIVENNQSKQEVTKAKTKARDKVFTLKPVSGESIKLLPTADYKYHKYPFEMFNPVQSLVLPLSGRDSNIVVGANTSAGKTICAEIVMDPVLALGKKVIYMSPLKALTQEKFTEWSRRFPNKKIMIMTGDYVLSEQKMKEVNEADIICMTSEMVDSRTRKISTEKNAWLFDVGLVIADESHIIGTSRGHAPEVGLMRFTESNTDAIILLLSATMPNVEEFAEWLTKLNGKKTEIVYCDWRPVVLNMNYNEFSTKGKYTEVRDRKIDMAVDLAISKPTEKFLVFVHDKNTGKEMLERFKTVGINAKFHNADLEMEKRIVIEDSFRDRSDKGLRVLIATSTVAWGSVVEDTPITLATGEQISANKVKPDSFILSYNEQTKQLEQDRVLANVVYTPSSEFVIDLEEAMDIITSPEHPVYVLVNDALVEKQARDLKRDDIVLYIDRNSTEIKQSKVLSIQEQPCVLPHRDITTEKNHNFFANGVLVHNCNLPARNVVVTGVTRGMMEVDELDLVQMFGRAGRFGIDDAGFVYFLVPEGTTEEWRERTTNLKPVTSTLRLKEIIAFHVLGEILNGNATTPNEIAQWYERSLAYIQEQAMDSTFIEEVLQELLNMRMIDKKRTTGSYSLTNLGRVSALLYYSPYDIDAWYKNFSSVLTHKKPDNMMLGWAIADIPTMRLPYIPKDEDNEMDEYKEHFYEKDIQNAQINPCAMFSIIAARCLLDGIESRIPPIQAAQRTIQMDIERTITALEMIDSTVTNWRYNWEYLGLRIKYGVSEELIDFVKIPGIGKKKAIALYELGFSSLQQIAEADPVELMGAFTKVASQEIVRQAKLIVEKDNKRGAVVRKRRM